MVAEPGYSAANISLNRLSNIYDISLTGNGSSAHYSFVTNNYIKITNNVYIANTCYSYNSSIKSVNLHNIPWVNNSIKNAFSGCTYLTNVTGISNTVTNAYCTFSSCSYLTNAPTLPDSIVSMDNTYSSCYNLVNVPSLPNNLTSMKSTFSSCNRLKNIPVIPESVTNMRSTFSNCSNLVNAPVIPNNVTYMGDTFNNCVNLTGNIYIQSSNITYANDCFNKTTNTKNVYIPFRHNVATNLYAWTTSLNHTVYTITPTPTNGVDYYYNKTGGIYNCPTNIDNGDNTWNIYSNVVVVGDENNVVITAGPSVGTSRWCARDSANDISVNIPSNSLTYNAFINAGYDINGTRNGVYLKDIYGMVVTQRGNGALEYNVVGE